MQERKNVLMKLDVTTNQKLVGVQIVKFITFLTRGITDKDTLMGTRVELIGMMNDSGIAKATKNSQMGEGRRALVQYFKRGLVRNHG